MKGNCISCDKYTKNLSGVSRCPKCNKEFQQDLRELGSGFTKWK